jgi:hypothetical protein
MNVMYRVSHKSWAIGELWLFGKIQKNVKKEKFLQVMFFQFQVLEFFTYSEPLRHHTFYIISSKSYDDVDMTVKGGCFSREGRSGNEGDTRSTGNSGNLPHFCCHVNMAPSP